MSENTKYTKAAIVSALCADICDQLAVKVHTGLSDYDEIEEKLVIVARALAKLAHEEGLPTDMIFTRTSGGVL